MDRTGEILEGIGGLKRAVDDNDKKLDKLFRKTDEAATTIARIETTLCGVQTKEACAEIQARIERQIQADKIKEVPAKIWPTTVLGWITLVFRVTPIFFLLLVVGFMYLKMTGIETVVESYMGK